jgi:quinone-modifying oxidoreductase subunit QmoC
MQKRIKYQEEVDAALGKEVISASGVVDLYRCIQCGTCSSTCPLNIYMDYTPRKIIAMTRAGFREEVLRSNSIWLCASCYACTVDCPRKINLTDIMYTLKRQAIEKGIYPRRLPIPVLAREFFASVMKTGRANEGRTVTWMILKTAPWKLLKQASLGLKLFLHGRLSVRKERLDGGVDQMRRLLDYVDAAPSKPPLT